MVAELIVWYVDVDIIWGCGERGNEVAALSADNWEVDIAANRHALESMFVFGCFEVFVNLLEHYNILKSSNISQFCESTNNHVIGYLRCD